MTDSQTKPEQSAFSRFMGKGECPFCSYHSGRKRARERAMGLWAHFIQSHPDWKTKPLPLDEDEQSS